MVVVGDGSDWNLIELGLLGDVSVAAPVTIFDDGHHDAPTRHEPAFPGVLHSIVAWDHVSWPGNDFYVGTRATDDGVKAAATSSMSVLTGVAGEYDAACGKHQPPPPYSNWAEVVDDRMRRGNLRLWNPRALWRVAQPM